MMSNLSGLEPIAVTGATGFIGRHLVRALVDSEFSPVLLARSDKDDETLSAFGAKLQTSQINLADTDSVRAAIEKVRPATLIHLAGTRGRDDARGVSAACEELNFHATVRLLEAANAAGVRRIVIVGSAEEYGNQPGPQDESLPLRATTAYGLSKAKATNHALEMHARNGCPVVIARPFTIYGPGQPPDMFVAEAVDSAVHNVEFRMSRGEQKRDLIFVEDVVEGLIAAALAERIEGKVVNLGTGQCHPLREVAQLIWKVTGATAPLLVGARNAPEEELYDTCADISVARRLLDWNPRVDLEAGLRRTIDFAREKNRTQAQAYTCQVM